MECEALELVQFTLTVIGHEDKRYCRCDETNVMMARSNRASIATQENAASQDAHTAEAATCQRAQQRLTARTPVEPRSE